MGTQMKLVSRQADYSDYRAATTERAAIRFELEVQ
jgi:hypothetical protein